MFQKAVSFEQPMQIMEVQVPPEAFQKSGARPALQEMSVP